MGDITHYDQYYLSYSGAQLPLKMVSPLKPEDIENRNTFFGVNLDAQGRIMLVQKQVYGKVELTHRYGYDDSDRLAWAEIHSIDEEACRLYFDTDGKITHEEELDSP